MSDLGPEGHERHTLTKRAAETHACTITYMFGGIWSQGSKTDHSTYNYTLLLDV